MNDLDRILECATRNIDGKYFYVDIADGSSRYRERVYCYELYHQMRKLWPADCVYTLNGEVDKRGHGLFKNTEVRDSIPDFLVHKPGFMDNHAIIEVKRQNTNDCNMKKDIKKLEFYRKEMGYKRGIYIIFGHEAGNSSKGIKEIIEEMRIETLFELWIHEESGQPAEKIYSSCAP